jgi:hypothetical protein
MNVKSEEDNSRIQQEIETIKKLEEQEASKENPNSSIYDLLVVLKEALIEESTDDKIIFNGSISPQVLDNFRSEHSSSHNRGSIFRGVSKNGNNFQVVNFI